MISDVWNLRTHIQLKLRLLSLCTKYTWFVFLLGFVIILISLSSSFYLSDKDEMMMLKLRRLTFRSGWDRGHGRWNQERLASKLSNISCSPSKLWRLSLKFIVNTNIIVNSGGCLPTVQKFSQFCQKSDILCRCRWRRLNQPTAGLLLIIFANIFPFVLHGCLHEPSEIYFRNKTFDNKVQYLRYLDRRGCRG